jgi:hypothetical protein
MTAKENWAKIRNPSKLMPKFNKKDPYCFLYVIHQLLFGNWEVKLGILKPAAASRCRLLSLCLSVCCVRTTPRVSQTLCVCVCMRLCETWSSSASNRAPPTLLLLLLFSLLTFNWSSWQMLNIIKTRMIPFQYEYILLGWRTKNNNNPQTFVSRASSWRLIDWWEIAK